MRTLLLKYKWHLLVVLVFIIAEPTLNSIMNFLLQRMFNAAAPGADKLLILRLLTAGFLLWMLKRVINYANGIIKSRFICSVRGDMKHELFSKLIGLNTGNIAELASSGEYVSIFTNDINLIENRYLSQLLGLISGLFSLAILGSSFVALNAKLAVPIIGFGLCTTFVPIIFSHKLNEKSLVFSKSISKFTQRVKEYVSAYPTIKNYAIEEEICTRFDQVNDHTENAKFDADCTLTLADCVGQLLAWFMQLIAVGLGLVFVVKGELAIGTVIAAQSFASDIAGPINSIITNANSIQSVKNIVSKLNRMVSGNAAAGEPSASGKEPPPWVESDSTLDNTEQIRLEFRHFSLTIAEKTIIKNFSFMFEPGKKYLIVGLNGSGKSTLFKALKNWYGDYSGIILLNDISAAEIANTQLSQHISYLNESVSLLTGTVKDNITLFRPCDAKTVECAIEAAHVEMELNRSINDEGKNISSGEQRRIEIARSLLSPSEIIIFDEVVSTLDIESAFQIEKMALGFKDRTVIFISHNFSGKLIRDYDCILVMQNGSLLDYGAYHELIGSCDYFRRICEIKFGGLDTAR